MAQLLISHEFQERLRSHMKLNSRQRQHVFSQHIEFQLNLTKIEKMPDTLKKSV